MKSTKYFAEITNQKAEKYLSEIGKNFMAPFLMDGVQLPQG